MTQQILELERSDKLGARAACRFDRERDAGPYAKLGLLSGCPVLAVVVRNQVFARISVGEEHIRRRQGTETTPRRRTNRASIGRDSGPATVRLSRVGKRTVVARVGHPPPGERTG